MDSWNRRGSCEVLRALAVACRVSMAGTEELDTLAFESWLLSRPVAVNAAYNAWLLETLGVASTDEMSLVHLSPDSSSRVGWRHVAKHTVLEKCLTWAKDKRWPPHGPQMEVVPEGDPSTLSWRYASGHQRACSLHMLLAYMQETQVPVPGWLAAMAKSLPAIKVDLDTSAACLRGVHTVLASETGKTAWSYVVLVQSLCTAKLGMQAGVWHVFGTCLARSDLALTRGDKFSCTYEQSNSCALVLSFVDVRWYQTKSICRQPP